MTNPTQLGLALDPVRERSCAEFDPSRRYRYVLRRRWSGGQRTVAFIGLNPSTADEATDDPTIRRCIGFARSWGYDGLVMLNLYALRSTDPGGVRVDVDGAVGPDNDRWLREEARYASLVVGAWGAHPWAVARAQAVVALLASDRVRLHALACTRSGMPGHPLYLPGHLRPTRWTAPWSDLQ